MYAKERYVYGLYTYIYKMQGAVKLKSNALQMFEVRSLQLWTYHLVEQRLRYEICNVLYQLYKCIKDIVLCANIYER